MRPSYAPNQLADQIRDYMAAWLVQDYPRYFLTVEAVTFSENRHTAYVWVKSFKTVDPSLRKTIEQRAPHYRHRLAAAISRRTIPDLQILVG